MCPDNHDGPPAFLGVRPLFSLIHPSGQTGRENRPNTVTRRDSFSRYSLADPPNFPSSKMSCAGSMRCANRRFRCAPIWQTISSPD
jgi:hypothetical protein